MLKREDYLTLIEEIRNIEKKSIDEFILKRLEPLKLENQLFIETLYKDVYYLIKDIDKKGDHSLIVQNGSLLIEDGAIKLSGYQSRLHLIAIWLHSQVVSNFIEQTPFLAIEKIESFEKNFLEKPDYTPEYKAKLDKIKKSLKQERQQNLGEKESLWSKLLDIDNLELKPNIMGLGLNGNELINKFRRK